MRGRSSRGANRPRRSTRDTGSARRANVGASPGVTAPRGALRPRDRESGTGTGPAGTRQMDACDRMAVESRLALRCARQASRTHARHGIMRLQEFGTTTARRAAHASRERSRAVQISLPRPAKKSAGWLARRETVLLDHEVVLARPPIHEPDLCLRQDLCGALQLLRTVPLEDLGPAPSNSNRSSR